MNPLIRGVKFMYALVYSSGITDRWARQILILSALAKIIKKILSSAAIVHNEAIACDGSSKTSGV
jgi:hypothetical protein